MSNQVIEEQTKPTSSLAAVSVCSLDSVSNKSIGEQAKPTSSLATISLSYADVAKKEKIDITKEVVNNQHIISDFDALKRASQLFKIDDPNSLTVISKAGRVRILTAFGEAIDESVKQRGLVFHDSGVMICRFPEYPLNLIADKIDLDTKDNKENIIIHGINGTKYIHPKNDISFARCFPGVQIAVFRVDGVTYYSTAKNLEPRNSRWCGRSDKFLDIAKRVGIPTEDELFDITKPHSCWYHIFILVDNKLLLTTQLDVKDGFAVYLGAQKSDLDKKYGEKDVDTQMRMPKNMIKKLPSYFINGTDEKTDDWDGKPFIYDNQPISIVEAQEHLLYGWNPKRKETTIDPRLTLGEVVVAKVGDSYFKIYSQAACYREMVCGEEPSRNARLNSLLTHFDAGQLAPYYLEEDKEGFSLPLTFSKNKVEKLDQEGKIKLIKQHFLWSVNPTDRDEVLKLIKKEIRIDINDLCKWMAKQFKDRYLIERSKNGQKKGYNKHLYDWLSHNFQHLKHQLRRLPTEKEMYDRLVSLKYNIEDLSRLDKARGFVNKMIEECK